MKTKRNKAESNKTKQAGGLVMKTKNNVQKAALKTLAVVLSLVLLSFTVNAQNFWKSLLENNSLNEIAYAMTVKNHETSSTKTETKNATNRFASATLMEAETEKELELEDWMVNDNFFGTVALMEEETEVPLELENWMTNESFFGTANLNMETEKEAPLELESWMTEENNFNLKTVEKTVIAKTEKRSKSHQTGFVTNKKFGKRTFIIGEDKDETLELEPWMLEKQIWN